MKINKIFYVILFCLSIGSCGKWLTIEPSDQISDTELYLNSSGFHNQINGIYKAMATASLYGRELTYGYVDALAQYYDFRFMSYTDQTVYSGGAAKYEHKHPLAIPVIKSIWEESYNLITNCNDLIEHAEVADSLMFKGKDAERKLIMGEAYALRAMLHFEMIRLFAKSPIMGETERYVPYVRKFGEKINPPIPTADALKYAIEDLEKAEKLTASYDIENSSMIKSLTKRLELPSVSKDRFLEYRGYRLNHYAIKALIARVSLYAGDKTKALKYSEELINLKWFSSFTTSYNFGTKLNRKLYDDVIFALYNNKQTNIYNENSVSVDEFLTILDFENIFGNETNDYRALQWADVQTVDHGILKRSYKTLSLTVLDWGFKDQYCNIMTPMLRGSEMYYIAAECLFSTNKVKAYKYIETVKNGRGVTDVTIPDVSTQDDFNQQVILNEMRREFYGEGQLFFFYKRLNLKITNEEGEVLNLGDKEFILPIPTSNNIN